MSIIIGILVCFGVLAIVVLGNAFSTTLRAREHAGRLATEDGYEPGTDAHTAKRDQYVESILYAYRNGVPVPPVVRKSIDRDAQLAPPALLENIPWNTPAWNDLLAYTMTQNIIDHDGKFERTSFIACIRAAHMKSTGSQIGNQSALEILAYVERGLEAIWQAHPEYRADDVPLEPLTLVDDTDQSKTCGGIPI